MVKLKHTSFDRGKKKTQLKLYLVLHAMYAAANIRYFKTFYHMLLFA
jgi:hypothetical protein